MLSLVLCVTVCATCAGVMCNIGKPTNARLLLRQLWHLALADFVSCFGAMFSIMGHELCPTCYWFHVAEGINSVGFWASLVLELHVSAGVGALYWRGRGLMQLLNHTLWVPWIIAVSETLVVFVVVDVLRMSKRSVDIKEGYALILLVSSTFISYVVAVMRGSCHPGRVSRRALCLLLGYSVALCMISPIAYAFLSDSLDQVALTGVSASLKGFFNVMLYSCLPNLSPIPPMRSARTLEAIESSLGGIFDQWAGRPSLSVGFAVRGHERISVEGVQRLALSESEKETAEFEASRGFQEDMDDSF